MLIKFDLFPIYSKEHSFTLTLFTSKPRNYLYRINFEIKIIFLYILYLHRNPTTTPQIKFHIFHKYSMALENNVYENKGGVAKNGEWLLEKGNLN